MAELYSSMLLRVLTIFIVLPIARASGVRQARYLRNIGMDGMHPVATALFQTPSHSPTHCGLQCTGLGGCRSYTYIADQPSSCRGYNVTMTSQNASDAEPAAGAKTFEVVLADGWLRTPCSEDSDCPVEKAECFKGLCLCTPGYYYSTGSMTCLDDCPLEDLGGVFVKYEKSVLTTSPFWGDYVTDVTECWDRCQINVTDCGSIGFSVSFYCMLYIDTARTAPSGRYRRDNPNCDYYQSTCA